MAIQVSKSISLTDYKTGEAFKLSANQIIYFMTNTAGVLEITYTDNRDNVIVRLVTQSAATVNTAAARTFAVTLESTGGLLYINGDKIIFVDDFTANTVVTYDSKKAYPDSLVVLTGGSAISTAAGNLLPITVAATGATRYINNLLVNAITADPDGSEIMYDAKGTENFSIIASQSPNAVQTLINAL